MMLKLTSVMVVLVLGIALLYPCVDIGDAIHHPPHHHHVGLSPNSENSLMATIDSRSEISSEQTSMAVVIGTAVATMRC
jgi:hypothetical protein